MKKLILLVVLGLFLQVNCSALGYGIPYETFKVSDINADVRKDKGVAKVVTNVNRNTSGVPIMNTNVVTMSLPYCGTCYPYVITATARHVQHRPRKGRVGNPLYKLDPDYQNYYY